MNQETFRPMLAIAERELWSVIRTRAYLLLAGAFIVVTLGFATVTGGPERGFVPTGLDLLAPMELLVPVLAIALGYRAILGDATRGELEVLRTYPLTPVQHVLGSFIGRGSIVVIVIALSLTLVGILVAVTPPDVVRIFATHETADSPVLFARFLLVTVVFGLVFLSIGLAISAIARSSKAALAIIAVVFLAVVIGTELVIVRGLAGGWVADDQLTSVLALAPHTAYRGLVLETALGIESPAGVRAASPVLSVVSLLVWLILSLAIAVIAIYRR